MPNVTIPFFNHTLSWNPSSIVLLDGLFFLSIGLTYSLSQAEWPLALYLGLKNSATIPSDVRPFSKLGMTWLGATDAGWSAMLLAIYSYLTESPENRLSLVPLAIMHTAASTGIGQLFTWVGFGDIVGVQTFTLILSVGAHGLFAILTWCAALGIGMKQAPHVPNKSTEHLHKQHKHGQSSRNAIMATIGFYVVWAAFMSLDGASILHPQLIKQVNHYTGINLVKYGVPAQSLIPKVFLPAMHRSANLPYGSSDPWLMFYLVASGSAAFGISIFGATFYLLHNVLHSNIYLAKRVHAAFAVAHAAQIVCIASFFMMPESLNLASKTGAYGSRWIALIAISVMLASVHYPLYQIFKRDTLVKEGKQK